MGTPIESAHWEVVRTDAGCHLRLRAANGEVVLVSETYTDDRPAARAVQVALSTGAVRSVDERDVKPGPMSSP